MLFLALLSHTAQAVIIPNITDVTDPAQVQWCARPKVMWLAESSETHRVPLHPKDVTATHLKIGGGKNCIILPDLKPFMQAPARHPDDVIGIMVTVNNKGHYTPHDALPGIQELTGRAATSTMDAERYDWQLDPGESLGFTLFTAQNDVLVVSGLSTNEVVHVILIRMHPDDAVSCVNSAENAYLVDCHADYRYETLLDLGYIAW